MLDLEPLYKLAHLHFNGLGRIEALLLTTFGLDVRYLEERILPSFFPDLGEGPAAEPQRPLYEYLEENPVPISVLFDANNLVRGDKPLPPGGGLVKELRWQAHPMFGRNNCFHPKLVIALLVDDEGASSLVVGCGSANLTQPGWGKNLEAYVFHTIKLRSGIRDGLLVDVQGLLEDLEQKVSVSEALPRLRRTIAAADPKPHGTNSYSRPRLWHGGMERSLSDFLSEMMPPQPTNGDRDWRLEILSPYYSNAPTNFFDWATGQLTLGDDTQPAILCCCPQIDGEFDIDPAVAQAHQESGQITWASLPAWTIRSKLKTASGESLTRFLHAKVYRFWRPQEELLIVGSANATRQGCRDGGQGNDEACLIFSRKAPPGQRLKAWLQPLDTPIEAGNCRAEPSCADDQDAGESLPRFGARFDWVSHELQLHNKDNRGLAVYLSGRSNSLAKLDAKVSESLVLEGDDVGALFRSPTLRLADSLSTDSKWLHLVEEVNLYAKPPAPTMERTADELIQDWQLGPDERLASRVARAESPAEQPSRTKQDEGWEAEIQSDRLNDVFLALWRFRRDMSELLGPDNAPDEYARLKLKTRIFGKGAMSLRYFVNRLVDAANQKSSPRDGGFDKIDFYICLLTVMDALGPLSNRLRAAGFGQEFRELTKFLVPIRSEARIRLRKELAQTDDAYPAKQLLDWVDANFRHDRATWNESA